MVVFFMALKPWNELTLAERRKFSISHRRNPRAVYEKIRKSEGGTPQQDNPSTESDVEG